MMIAQENYSIKECMRLTKTYHTKLQDDIKNGTSQEEVLSSLKGEVLKIHKENNPYSFSLKMAIVMLLLSLIEIIINYATTISSFFYISFAIFLIIYSVYFFCFKKTSKIEKITVAIYLVTYLITAVQFIIGISITGNISDKGKPYFLYCMNYTSNYYVFIPNSFVADIMLVASLVLYIIERKKLSKNKDIKEI